MTKRLITGYLLCLACIGAAFWLMQRHLATGHIFPSHEFLLPVFVILALAQLVVQVVFFLHPEKASRGWSWFIFAFAALIATLVVGGTLWIMANLNHNGHTEPFDGTPSPQHEH